MEQTKRIVMKFGGKCLANLALIKAVADYLKEYLAKYPDFKIIAVVSAMGSFTDDALRQINELAPTAQKKQGREIDYVTQAGEGISAGLLAIRLNEIGVSAISLNALQLGISTTGNFQEARITNIDRAKLENELSKQDVLVVTGFQGVHESDAGVIVTLGRGGSDTTAVAVAASLGCGCQFYKKANGVTVCDSDLAPNAKVLKFCTYGDALDMATYGYEFLHPRCLEIAQRFGIQLEFKASPGLGGDPWAKGTVICERQDVIEEQPDFRAIAVKEGITLITIHNVPNQAGWSAKIFNKVENLNLIDFQQIIYGLKRENALIAIILTDEIAAGVKENLQKWLERYPELQISSVSGLANLTFIDAAMSQQPGFALALSEILAQEGINIEGQYTSGKKIHTQIASADIANAILALAKHFSLIEQKA